VKNTKKRYKMPILEKLVKDIILIVLDLSQEFYSPTFGIFGLSGECPQHTSRGRGKKFFSLKIDVIFRKKQEKNHFF